MDGFQRGKEEGFAQGRAEAQKRSHNAVAVIESELPKMDVLVIAAGMIPSLEIGVIQPLSALKKQENLQFDVKLETDVTHEMVAAANTIVFVRNVEPAAYALLEMAHQLKKGRYMLLMIISWRFSRRLQSGNIITIRSEERRLLSF